MEGAGIEGVRAAHAVKPDTNLLAPLKIRSGEGLVTSDVWVVLQPIGEGYERRRHRMRRGPSWLRASA